MIGHGANHGAKDEGHNSTGNEGDHNHWTDLTAFSITPLNGRSHPPQERKQPEQQGEAFGSSQTLISETTQQAQQKPETMRTSTPSRFWNR